MAHGNASNSITLRQHYTAALSRFISRLELPGELVAQIRNNLENNRSTGTSSLLTQLTDTNQAAKEHSTSSAPAGKVLLNLFGRLSNSEPSADNSQTTPEVSGINAEELPNFLSDLSELLQEQQVSKHREKRVLEEFIEQLVSQIHNMEKFVTTLQDDLQAARGNRNELQSAFDTEVGNMQQQLSTAKDLQQLKADVSQRLKNITHRMSTFRQREDTRMQINESRNHSISQELTRLQQESAELQKQLIENRQALMIDPVTQISSRFAYEERAAQEFTRWKRFKTPTSLIIWDLDYFKTINDTFGHQAGDRVLRLIAQLINNRIRETDFLARIGGEEFAMLLPGANPDQALKLANEIRTKVSSAGFNHHGQAVRITISCGITQFIDQDTLESAFERADQALYLAKNQGRNCCIMAKE